MNRPNQFINPLVAKAVEKCGSQAALAKRCNSKQQVVWKWLRMERVPAERAIAIEVATDGYVTRFDLRPDVFEQPPPCPNCSSVEKAAFKELSRRSTDKPHIGSTET